FAGQAELIAQCLQDRFGTSKPTGNKDSVDALLALAFEEADRITHFHRQPRERVSADLGHSFVALLNHEPRGVSNESVIGGQRPHEGLADVIDTAHQNQFASAADQDRALEMTHVEKEESFVRKNFGIGKFECVERTNRAELK